MTRRLPVISLQHRLLRRFANREEPVVLVLHVQARVCFALGGNAEIPEKQRAQAFAHVGGILRVVSQDERLETEKRLAGGVVTEVDAQTDLVGSTAAAAARMDGDVAYDLT